LVTVKIFALKTTGGSRFRVDPCHGPAESRKPGTTLQTPRDQSFVHVPLPCKHSCERGEAWWPGLVALDRRPIATAATAGTCVDIQANAVLLLPYGAQDKLPGGCAHFGRMFITIRF
jgi:hypothetical protein